MNVGRSKYYFGLGGWVLFVCWFGLVCKDSIRLLHYPNTDLLCNFELLCTRTEIKITEGNYASLTLKYH